MTTQLVTDTAAADFLTSSNTRYLLSPFIEKERSMAETASLLNMKLSTFYRRVKQMQALGLVKTTRTETRDGHKIKLYQTTSLEFIVPIEATRNTDRETFVGDGARSSATILGRGIAKEMETRAPRWGFRIFWNDGVFQQATALGEDGALLEPTLERSVYGDCGLRLTPGDAQTFGDELQALYEKYLALGKPEGEPYFLFIGFSPL